MILLRNTFCSLSTHTRPCIWYAIPIALIAAGSYLRWACTLRIASCTCSHHISGDCSAHPCCTEMTSDSVSGYWALAIHCCEEASTTDALIDDVPMSKPR